MITAYWLIWVKLTYLKKYYETSYTLAFLQLAGVFMLWLTVFLGVIYLIGFDSFVTWLNDTLNIAPTIVNRRGPNVSEMLSIDFGYIVLVPGIICCTIFGVILGAKHLQRKTLEK